ncbi:MAG: succinate dehydrogenase assembly factor 2 [Pseudomonadota bacterium]
MTETPEIRRKRLYMRATHRGIKEMDIIMGHWARVRLGAADADLLAIFEELLEENDQDLYQWVSQQAVPPLKYKGIVADLRDLMDKRKDFA